MDLFCNKKVAMETFEAIYNILLFFETTVNGGLQIDVKHIKHLNNRIFLIPQH